jgi:Ca2+/Na+ antiporter
MAILLSLLVLSACIFVIARVVKIYFIEVLAVISHRLKLSSDIARATFMAVGSSAPELFIAIFALFSRIEHNYLN